MSTYLIPSLETLPVEILHRVFDSLDAQTILSSVRGTCRRFQALVNSYERFILNFKQISKSDFDLICRLIDPQNVISLTLSHDDETCFEIELFISHFDTKQFSRLRSLTLIGIEEYHLRFLLKCVNINSLISFSLTIGKPDDRHRKTTATLLSSVIAQANLHRFEFEISSDRSESPTWPVQWMIQHLRISACTAFCPCPILQCSPVLQILIIIFPKLTNHLIFFPVALKTSFRQLNSLTLENVSTKIDVLEMLLSLVPSLTHFKLIGAGDFLDGNRWEQFIQMNLPFLNKFEFFIEKSADTSYDRPDVDSIITSFQTPFWVEQKKWFVTCEYHKPWPRSVKLYSIPICVSSLVYPSESKKDSRSTSGAKTDNEVSLMDNVKTIQLNFPRIAMNDIQNKAEPAMLAEIASLLQQTRNLSSLDLCFSCEHAISDLTAEDICLMTPSHVRHLAVTIESLNEIKIVLERLDHLSSAKFTFRDKSSSRGFIKWFKEKRNGSTYRINSFTLSVWFGKKHIQPTEVNVGTKRIKLTDDHQDS